MSNGTDPKKKKKKVVKDYLGRVVTYKDGVKYVDGSRVVYEDKEAIKKAEKRLTKFDGPFGDLKAMASGAHKIYTGVKSDIKNSIKSFAKDNLPPDSDHAKKIAKWKKGGKIKHFRDNKQYD